MLRLRDIMTADVVTLAPETQLREALDILGRQHLSGAPVVSGGRVVGVVTTTDLMNFAAGLSGVPTTQQEGEDWVEWAEPGIEQDVEAEVEAASAYFTELWDDAGAESDQRMSRTASPEWNALEEHDVSEAMTLPPLIALPPDASVETAAALMRDRRVHRVLVMESDHLVGVVTSFDVTRAVADRKLTRRVLAFNHDDDFRSFE